ncbi:hypothetical protein MKEN_01052300 [Mycena kentingensis (nom. inval.)]|nr:hypothetical protein MKEN_01052300 [Mycena kentingensis (nom. inval.)]
MSSSDHSSDHSMTFYEKTGLIDVPAGSCRVKYMPGKDWDFHMYSPHKPIDLSLVLPHFRARGQPIDSRISMFVGSEASPMKLKVCRAVSRSKFELEVRVSTSDVTIWLPSDFKGVIHCPKSTKFSAGFVNRIMANARLHTTGRSPASYDEDEVIVATRGRVTFRMWDVHTNAPECVQVEALKRLFGCARKVPETSHDWDFLLED